MALMIFYKLRWVVVKQNTLDRISFRFSLQFTLKGCVYLQQNHQLTEVYFNS